MIEHLRHDHDRLRAIAAQLRILLKDDSARSGMCLATARWALTRELLRHMAMEKQFLRDHPIDPARSTTASPHDPEQFERRYRTHLARWTATEIDAHWREYRRELGTILDTLEQHMQFEERVVFSRPADRAAALGGRGSRA
jgi:hypothetical protein